MTIVNVGGKLVITDVEPKKMNKADLVAEVAKLSGMTKTDSEKAVEATLNAVQSALKAGDDVRLVGFGTFSVVHRAAGEGRNPRTGEKIQIAASKQPKFAAGKGLKAAVNS